MPSFAALLSLLIICSSVLGGLRMRRCLLRLSSSTTPVYQYLDSGNRRRLERFGEYVVARNCPSAVWSCGLPASTWASADVVHDGTSWSRAVSEDWSIKFENDMAFQLALSEQGQVGIFPEQQEQWRWIRSVLSAASDRENIRVLNGFAYTGGSTLASLTGHARANVTHLDASSAAVNWASRNLQASGVADRPGVRLLVDDCLTFLRREKNRGKRYEALIFDPPAFGRGGGSKVWKLEKDLPMLLDLLLELLSDEPLFLLLSCHDPSWGPDELAALMQSRDAKALRGASLEKGEMVLRSDVKGARPLPLGSYVRLAWP